MPRISEEAAITTLAGTELVVVVDVPGVAGGTKKMTALDLARALALLAPTAWAAAPAFAGAWVNFGAPWQVAQTCKVGDRVYLRGRIKSGTINTAAFTLIAGQRPPADIGFPVNSNGAYGWVSITAAGVVTPVIGNTAYVDLSNISFSTVA